MKRALTQKIGFFAALVCSAAAVQSSFAQTGLVVIAGSNGAVNPVLERCLDLSVISDYRGALSPLYDSKGQAWVSSSENEPYSIQIQNRCSYRLLASVAVDGLNVVDGQTLGVGGAGYVIDGFGKRIISGWRTSLSEVSRFYFTSPSESYVFKRTGRNPSGRIELGLYTEQYPVQVAPTTPLVSSPSTPGQFDLPSIVASKPVPVQSTKPQESRSRPALVGTPGNMRFAQPLERAKPAPSAVQPSEDTYRVQGFASESPSSVGTGFGASVNSSVVVSDFKPTSVLPVLRMELRYAPLTQLNQMNLSAVRPNGEFDPALRFPGGFSPVVP